MGRGLSSQFNFITDEIVECAGGANALTEGDEETEETSFQAQATWTARGL